MTSTDVFPEGPLSMYLLIYLVRHSWKLLKVAISKQLSWFSLQDFRMYRSIFLARLSTSTNFTVVCLTVHKGSGFTEVPWAINSETKPNHKRWSGLDSDNSCTPFCLFYSTSGVQALPVWPTCQSVGSWFQSKLHVPHLLCWHCSFNAWW